MPSAKDTETDGAVLYEYYSTEYWYYYVATS
jgi:hypothetical protein